MIADLDKTIRQLLKEELPIKNNEIEVGDRPARMQAVVVNAKTILDQGGWGQSQLCCQGDL